MKKNLFDEKKYNALLDSLFEKHQSVQKVGFNSDAYKPGLAGMSRFSEALGDPWRKFRSIHVAGTNGKGSVSSMLAAALAANGMRVGLYTSPHLVDFRERMKIVGPDGWEMISKQEVWEFCQDYEEDMEGLSFFEITTGMAFRWFADRQVDAAVVEVGLGGRLDSTNIIEPELCIVTSIGLDHCGILGDTREKIAAEKAGIFKPGVPALVGFCDEQTAPVFEQAAAEVHCPLFFAEGEVPEMDLDLQGPYQEANLLTVLNALDILGEDPDSEAIAHTAERTGFRGRWESLRVGEQQLICDIGHNPAALEINFSRLKALGRPLFIVYGIMADKDIQSIRPMMPNEAKYFLVAPAISRSMDVHSLAEEMKGLDITIAGSVEDGTKMAIQAASTVKDALIYVGGSNFVVSECISYLEQ